MNTFIEEQAWEYLESKIDEAVQKYKVEISLLKRENLEVSEALRKLQVMTPDFQTQSEALKKENFVLQEENLKLKEALKVEKLQAQTLGEDKRC